MRLPKYRRHNRDLGFVEFQGKRIYFSGKYGSPQSRREYAEFIAQHFGIQSAVTIKPDTNRTLEDLVADFLDWARAYYGDSSKSEYHNLVSIAKHVVDICGPLPVDDFGPAALKHFRDQLIRRKIARSTVNKYATKVRMIFRWGASEGLCRSDLYQALAAVPPLTKGRTDARETSEKTAVDWEDVEPVLDHVRPVVAEMIRLQWLTGARSQNVCNCQGTEIDRSDSIWVWKPKRHKTAAKGHQIIIYLGKQAQEILLPRLLTEFAFEASPGKPYATQSYYQAVQRGIKAANRHRKEKGLAPISRWSPHQLRHAAGTRVRAALGAEAAQAFLGHATLEATQIYSESRLSLAKTFASLHG